MFYLINAETRKGDYLGVVCADGYSSLGVAVAASSNRMNRDYRRGLTPLIPQIVDIPNGLRTGASVHVADVTRLFDHCGMPMELPGAAAGGAKK